LVGHAEIAAAVADQLVGFDEGAFVQQEIDTLSGGKFTFGVLAFATLVAASGLSAGVASAQFFQSVGH
jgi:hypothetical protein